MTEHYDVIIIGSGAGGGTLAHTLAGSGKRILLLERGDFLPREMDNWDPEPVFVHGKYISKDTWYDADGKPFQPQVHYYVGGATKLYGAALYRLRPAGLRRAAPRRRALAGVAADLRRLRALVHERPSGSTRSTATPARTRPRATGRSRTRGRRSRTSRGSSSSSDDLEAGGYHPFHAPVRHPARRGRPGQEHLHPLHVVRRLPLPRPRQGRRRDDRGAPGARPAQRHAAGRRRGDPARDRRGRAHRDRRRRVPRRRARRRTRATSSSSRPARRTRPSSSCSSANDRHPERPGQRLGPGRPELHVPQLQGRRRAGQGAQRHRLPEDARPQRLLLRRARTTSGRPATSR